MYRPHYLLTAADAAAPPRLLPPSGLLACNDGKPAKQRLLSRDQYELAEVRTSRRGVRPTMLFPKAILEAEWAADAPFREAMAIKRERLRVLRAKRAAERAAKQRST